MNHDFDGGQGNSRSNVLNCRRVNGWLSSYVDGELTGSEMLAIREHLKGCLSCSREHAALRETKRLVASLAYKAPRAELEALLLHDRDRVGQRPGGLVTTVPGVLFADANGAGGVRVRPLAATVIFSLAGLWLATTALDAPGDGSREVTQPFLATTMGAYAYVSPAALTPAPPVTFWGSSSARTDYGYRRDSISTVSVQPPSCSVMGANCAVVSLNAAPTAQFLRISLR